MSIVIVVLPVFGCPCGSTAPLAAVHVTVCLPLPSTDTPADVYGFVAPPSALQSRLASPDGPVCPIASTVAAWLTAHPPGFASFGVLSDTVGCT
jgi:hypothetical protein